MSDDKAGGERCPHRWTHGVMPCEHCGNQDSLTDGAAVRAELDDWRTFGFAHCGPPITCDQDMRDKMENDWREMANTITRLRAELEAARKELAMLKGRRFPVLDGGMTVPWQMLAPHEPQAIANHSQSLELLAKRGGLGWVEMICVLNGNRYTHCPTEHAKEHVLQRVADYERSLTGNPQARTGETGGDDV